MASAPSSIEAEAFSDEDYDALAHDFELYAPAALMLRTKAGRIEPFYLNASQRAVHVQLENQIDETGQVRALILKGRQQGISTYVGGRFYWKTTHRRGFRTHILTHLDEATANLFEMTQRFHEHCPEDLKPETGSASAKELTFPSLASGYKIGTAGGRAPGRSSTIQCFHGSEFGFWPNAEENLAGILEAVPNEDDTEIILESTANKPGDAFHRLWKAAKTGESRFAAIFLAWFIHEEYAIEPPPDWTPPPAFALYQAAHELTGAQIYWAYCKNRDMAGVRGLSIEEFCAAFKREYPGTDEEAFEAADDDLARVIPMAWIRLAQQRWKANQGKDKGLMTGLGCDVAQGGPDRTVFAPLHGVRFEPVIPIAGELTTDGPAVAGAAIRYVRDRATIAVDLGGGWGGGALSHMKQLGLNVIGVNPSMGVTRTARRGGFKFRNERAALWWDFHEAMDPVAGDAIELPDDEELAEELSSASFEVGPSGLQIEAKDDIIERLRRSTDKADAVLLAWRAGKANARRYGLQGEGQERAKAPKLIVGHASAKAKWRGG